MVQLKKEYSLPGNDEFWLEELEADDKDWICISSHSLKKSYFFFFWSKPTGGNAMPSQDIIAELANRLEHVHDEGDSHKLENLVKFKTPGWDQWSFGTPGVLVDYLYGVPLQRRPHTND